MGALASMAAPALGEPGAQRPRARGHTMPADDVIESARLSGRVSFAVADLSDGELIETRGGAIAQPPASVAKAVTALYALEALGPSYRFRTQIVATGPLRNGRLEGDLILVGSRGKSPLENRVIGSTARNLARTTVVPLLVDRIERGVDDPNTIRRHLFERTLFATDFSENAERAFETFEYLRHATREVTLTHVRSPKDDTGDVADVESRMEPLIERLDEWGLDARIDIRRGDPAQEILAAEREHDPSTILIGSRGRSRLRRLLLGNVSEDVVANATGNVFLVPPPRSV